MPPPVSVREFARRRSAATSSSVSLTASGALRPRAMRMELGHPVATPLQILPRWLLRRWGRRRRSGPNLGRCGCACDQGARRATRSGGKAPFGGCCSPGTASRVVAPPPFFGEASARREAAFAWRCFGDHGLVVEAHDYFDTSAFWPSSRSALPRTRSGMGTRAQRTVNASVNIPLVTWGAKSSSTSGMAQMNA